MTVKLGIDVVREREFHDFDGVRVGLLTNLSAVDSTLTTTYQRFTESVNVTALFAPEHGIYGMQADGEHVTTETDPRTGITVYSLYGEHKAPSPDILESIDMLVCDIQDIGVRYYTFMGTVLDAARAARASGVEVVILDRPNPLGGYAHGAPIRPRFYSIVGAYDAPTMHGLTMGEAVRYVLDDPSIKVIQCENWSASMRWPQTGLAWVPPSPAMAHYSTLQHYPGSCLIEGTNLSEGRGTALPFEIVGAPGLDALELAASLNWLNFPGVRFRPHSFKPTANKHAGQVCHGVQAHITDASIYDPLRTWLGVLLVIRHTAAHLFEWKPPYQDIPHFDLLIGSDQVRVQIDSGASLDDICASWESELIRYQHNIRPYLLYER